MQSYGPREFSHEVNYSAEQGRNKMLSYGEIVKENGN